MIAAVPNIIGWLAISFAKVSFTDYPFLSTDSWSLGLCKHANMSMLHKV